MRQVNLLPENLKKIEEIKSIRYAVVNALSPMIIIMALVHFFFFWQAYRMQTLADPSKFLDLQVRADLKQKTNALHSQMQGLYKEHRVLLDSGIQQMFAAKILMSLGKTASGKVWLEELNLDYANKTCRIAGQSYSTRLATEFMLELKQSIFLKSVELRSMEKNQDGKIEFLILCGLY